MVNRTIRLVAVSIAYVVMLAHGLLPHHHHSITFALDSHADHHHTTATQSDHQHDIAWEAPHYANEMDHSHSGDDSGHDHSVESHSPSYLAPKLHDIDGGTVILLPMVAVLEQPLALPLVEEELPPLAFWESPPPLSRPRHSACGLRAPPAFSA